MRAKSIVGGILFLAAGSVLAQPPAPTPGLASNDKVWGYGSTAPRVPWATLENGALYELRLRIDEVLVPQYLAHYAEYYLPVDSAADSGRELVSVAVREFGDQYNVVFLYRYDSRYKEGYYCKYAKAFFLEHSKKGHKFEAVADADRKKILAALEPATCNRGGIPHIPEAVDRVIREQDQILRNMVRLDEATWNFEVNLCKFAKYVAGAKESEIAACPSMSEMKKTR